MKYIGVCTPAWTIPEDHTRQKWEDQRIPKEHEFPGPTDYNSAKPNKETYTKAPEWKFGSDEKRAEHLINRNGVPGPGKYDPHSKKKRFRKRNRDRPFKRPFITKEERLKEKNRDNHVGPGSFEPRKITKSAPRFSFGYRFKPETNEDETVVGPGKYDPKYSSREFRKTSTFSKAKKKTAMKEAKFNGTPGPGFYTDGWYSMKNLRKKGKRGSRLSKASSKKLVGSKVTKDGAKKGFWSSAKRFKRNVSETPGVGEYFKKNGKDEKWTIRRETKPVIESLNDQQNLLREFNNGVPGPGKYTPAYRTSKKHGPKFTIGKMKRPKLNKNDPTVPGPDTYQTIDTTSKVVSKQKYIPVTGRKKTNTGTKPLYTFGCARRKGMMNNKKAPGPGRYHLQYINKGLLTNKQKHPRVFNTQYSSKPGDIWRTNSAPKFSFKGKRSNKAKPDNIRFPGPGSYYPEDNFRIGPDGGPEHIIGTGLRSGMSRRRQEATPGPGDYNISLGLGKLGVGFAKSERRGPAVVDPDIEVGPATYDIKSTVPQLQPWEENAQKEQGFAIDMEKY